MSVSAGKAKASGGEAPAHAPAPARAAAGARGLPTLAGASAFTMVQQAAGNLAIQRMLGAGGVRAKLSIGQPDDPDEREADRIAERVMRAPAASGAGAPPVQGIARTAPATTPADGPLGNIGAGQPLDRETRSYFEPRFGADFSQVRVHSGDRADAAASAIQAKAFTAGQSIVLGHGQHATHRAEGGALLAHELAHTLQPARSDGHQHLHRKPDGAPDSSAPPTLSDLVREKPPGFNDAKLDEAYQSYLHKNKTPADPATWAVSVTVGAPRERFEKLLGPDYAKGQRSALARPPIDVTSPAMPTGYDATRQQEDLQTVQSSGSALTRKMGNLTYSGDTGLTIGSGDFSNLKGNVGEALARPLIDEVLAELRKEFPDAQLYRPRAELYVEKEKDWTPPLEFTDGIIAVITPKGLRILRVVEVKTGKDGGVTAQEQVHRWIENHSTHGMRLVIPGIDRKFEVRGNVKEIEGLANAPRLMIVPKDAKLVGERSGHGTAAKVIPLRMSQTAEEVAYLTSLTAQRLLLESQARQVLEMAKNQSVQPKALESTWELQEPETITRVLNENNGLAIVDGAVYRVSRNEKGAGLQRLPMGPLELPQVSTGSATPGSAPPSPKGGGTPPSGVKVDAPPAGATPFAGTPLFPPPSGRATPTAPLDVPGLPGQAELAPGVSIPTNVINVSGQPIVVQGRVVQPSQPVELREGDIVVRGASGSWKAVNAETGEPIAAVFEGGRLYTVVSGKSLITIGEDGRVVAGTGTPVTEIPLSSEPAGAAGRAATPRSLPMRGAAAGLGLFVVVNDIIGPIGRNLALQRAGIAMARARFDFWAKFGASPRQRVWNIDDRAALPEGDEADTSILWAGSVPYITELDTQGLATFLPKLITSYRDFALFLDSARSIDAIETSPEMPASPSAEQRREARRYSVWINARDPDSRYEIDITDIIVPLGERLLGELDVAERGKVGALSESQRKNIFRLRHGSETTLYRSARGGQPILSSAQLLGNDPWVRLLGRELEGGAWQWFARRQWRDRVLVVPANADAQRAAGASSYVIKKTPNDVLDEVTEGHRPILSREPPSGTVFSFVAGSEPGESRFGETRYYRHPNWPDYQWTVAIGELTQWWVNERDLEPVGLEESDAYAKGAPSPRP